MLNKNCIVCKDELKDVYGYVVIDGDSYCTNCYSDLIRDKQAFLYDEIYNYAQDEESQIKDVYIGC